MKFLGAIVLPAGVGKNNRNTAAPFVIPAGTRIRLQTTGNDVCVEVTTDADANSTFTTDATKGYLLPANGKEEPPTGKQSAPIVVAGFSTAGATIRVWALLG